MEPAGNNTDSFDTSVQDCFDADGDLFVTIIDVLAVALHFGEMTGDLGFDPVYDLDGDGFVTIIDILLVAMHFGQVC